VAGFLVEGAASVFSVAAEFRAPVRERSHTRYDPLLGWVGAPGVRIDDLYGGGTPLTTNSRGFRGTAEVADAISAGTVRLVCAGDSFTLGHGVGDADTWCAGLAGAGPGIETVNMGQGGYGIDQAWLGYRRDATFRHDVLLFAFSYVGFGRMSIDSFLGYGKPLLRLDGDRLTVTNTPVPRRSYFVPWLTENLPVLEKLNAVRLGRRIFRAVGGEPRPLLDGVTVEKTALAVFDDLARLCRERGVSLVLVYLPSMYDLDGSGRTDRLREWLRRELPPRGLTCWDLVGELASLPEGDYRSRFILDRPNNEGFGHYNATGHRLIVGLLGDRLRAASLLDPRR
jgi:hypothetical protein